LQPESHRPSYSGLAIGNFLISLEAPSATGGKPPFDAFGRV